MKTFLQILFLGIAFCHSNQGLAQSNGLLYSITKDSNKDTSFLYGTMHLMSEEMFFFPKRIEEILSNCNALCLEIKELESQNIDPDLLFDESKPIKQYFSEPQWDSIVNWAENSLLMNKSNFEINFKSAKPFILIQFMTLNGLPNPHKSHELELEKIAKANNLLLRELESIDTQLKIFDKIPYSSQINMIMSTLSKIDDAPIEFENMQKAYVAQNLDSLCSFTEMSDFKEFESELLLNRNLNWIPKMIVMMKKEKTFFAVGAGHLCGKNGLIELLYQEGYKVDCIKL